MEYRDQIEEFLRRRDIVSPAIVAGWIAPGLTSSRGAFIVERIMRLHISGDVVRRPFRFACTCDASLGPDFNSRARVRYVFTLAKSGRFKGRFGKPTRLPQRGPLVA